MEKGMQKYNKPTEFFSIPCNWQEYVAFIKKAMHCGMQADT
jgi:hypothetical protein